MQARSRPGNVTAAAVILIVKSALGMWGAFALLAASRTHHLRFLGGVVRHRHAVVGTILAVLAAASVVVAVALLLLVPWGRVGAFVVEGAGIILALSRIIWRPGSSLLSLVLSLLVIGLLVSPTATAVFAGGVSRPRAGES